MAGPDTSQEAEVCQGCSHSHRFQVQEEIQLLVKVTFQGKERICGVVGTGGCRFFHSTDIGHICTLGETELFGFYHTGLYQHP